MIDLARKLLQQFSPAEPYAIGTSIFVVERISTSRHCQHRPPPVPLPLVAICGQLDRRPKLQVASDGRQHHRKESSERMRLQQDVYASLQY